MFKAKCDLGIQAPKSLNEFSQMETACISHKDNSIFLVVKALLLLLLAVVPILRSSHPSCCLWVAVGVVSPVVPGDRRLGLLAPLEMHPGCVSGRLTWLGSLLISSWRPWCPTAAQAAWAPIGPYHRVDGVCEAAWHAVWSFYRWFCGRQSARSRCGRGKIRRLVRCSNGVAPHRSLRDQHERRR